MIKFHNKSDETMFNKELTEVRKLEKDASLTEGDFIKKRKAVVRRVKNFRKSQDQKGNWRANRWKIMKGIKTFHKSTAGKNFHRNLGRFISTRDFSKLTYRESRELLKPIVSSLQHAYIEFDFYQSVTEAIEYELFTDEMFVEVSKVLSKIHNEETDYEDEAEMLIRIVETAELVKSFASESGKTVAEVEKLWNKAKASAKKQGKTEDDDGFFKLVVGILKKMLKID